MIQMICDVCDRPIVETKDYCTGNLAMHIGKNEIREMSFHLHRLCLSKEILIKLDLRPTALHDAPGAGEARPDLTESGGLRHG